MARLVVFLSDFGLDDGFAGVCHGVIARRSPESRVIDLTHSVPPRDVLHGALVLAAAAPYMPEDAVFLAVVDPGVGTERIPVAVETPSGAALVGPDNGVLCPAWSSLGGASAAVRIESPDVLLSPVSATFHGRDVFAPAAAHLAAGRAVQDLGPAIDPAALTVLDLPRPEVRPGSVACRVVWVDRFGNVALGAGPADLSTAGLGDVTELRVELHERTESVPRVTAFGQVEPGGPALLVDSAGRLALIENGGDAARRLGLSRGDLVVLRHAGPG